MPPAAAIGEETTAIDMQVFVATPGEAETEHVSLVSDEEENDDKNNGAHVAIEVAIGNKNDGELDGENVAIDSDSDGER